MSAKKHKSAVANDDARTQSVANDDARTQSVVADVRREEALLKAGALQNAILNSANFSSIAIDSTGVIQIFNVGAERMLGYTAVEVLNKTALTEISDPQEVIARAKALNEELGTTIAPGFEASSLTPIGKWSRSPAARATN
jgi:PAS domain-containing protein